MTVVKLTQSQMFALASKYGTVQLLSCSFNLPGIKSHVLVRLVGLFGDSVSVHVCCVVPFLVRYTFYRLSSNRSRDLTPTAIELMVLVYRTMLRCAIRDLLRYVGHTGTSLWHLKVQKTKKVTIKN